MLITLVDFVLELIIRHRLENFPAFAVILIKSVHQVFFAFMENIAASS